jgi:adenosylcobinamide-phosphate synthase
VTAAAAVGLALTLDLCFEEFPGRVHPVAVFGRAVGAVDRPWSTPGVVGAIVASTLPVGAALLGGALTALATRYGPAFGAAVAALALFSTTSLRMLLSAAADVIDRTDSESTTDRTGDDLDGARDAVKALVGRDASTLSAGELRSAAVESAAENLADGLVAPLLAFALGAQVSLPAAVAAAVWVKAVNTLDSMLGYPSKPVGRASARLDDAVMWVPARAAAVLLALAGGFHELAGRSFAAGDRPAPGRTLADGRSTRNRTPVVGAVAALWRARSYAREPPSPNSGWPMATLAAVLGVELRKPGAYDLDPGAELPTATEARAGIRVVGVAGLLAALLAGLLSSLPPGVMAWP